MVVSGRSTNEQFAGINSSNTAEIFLLDVAQNTLGVSCRSPSWHNTVGGKRVGSKWVLAVDMVQHKLEGRDNKREQGEDSIRVLGLGSKLVLGLGSKLVLGLGSK